MTLPRMEQSGPDVLLWIKAVPGASRDQISGVLGDRLKIRVSAPPEGGKANKAIIALITKTFALKSSQVEIESGHAHAEKTLRLRTTTIAKLHKWLDQEFS